MGADAQGIDVRKCRSAAGGLISNSTKLSGSGCASLRGRSGTQTAQHRSARRCKGAQRRKKTSRHSWEGNAVFGLFSKVSANKCSNASRSCVRRYILSRSVVGAGGVLMPAGGKLTTLTSAYLDRRKPFLLSHFAKQVWTRFLASSHSIRDLESQTMRRLDLGRDDHMMGTR